MKFQRSRAVALHLENRREIPIAAKLPNALPNALDVVEMRSERCVERRVLAELKGSGTFWDCKLKRAFSVRSKKPLNQEPKPCAMRATATVRSIAAFKRGVAVLAAKVDDTLLDREETAVSQVVLSKCFESAHG